MNSINIKLLTRHITLIKTNTRAIMGFNFFRLASNEILMTYFINLLKPVKTIIPKGTSMISSFKNNWNEHSLRIFFIL